MDSAVSFPENWTPPRELSRALPRETQLTGRGMFSTILAVVLLAGAIPMYVLLHNEDVARAARNTALRSQGRETSGEISRLWHKGKSNTPMVSYAFGAGGVWIHGESAVPQQFWPGIQKTGVLPIRYLPANPTTNHPAAWDEALEPVWVPLVFPLMLAACGIFLLMNLRRQRAILAEGLPAAGVIRRCDRMKGGWVARYHFRTKDGVVSNGSDKLTRRPEPGAAVCVLYLPENPRRNKLYPVCFYKMAQ